MADPDVPLEHGRPTVLLVAGIDPTAGAGLLLDAAVVRHLGLHPLGVTTGVAVQNTSRLANRQDLPGSLLGEQLAVLAEEFLLGAVKTGMLPTTEIMEALADWLAERPRLPLVLDPVLRTTSGGDLIEPAAIDTLTRLLIPRARVITPNLEEAAVLSGRPITDREQVPGAAQALLQLGADWVLVKGGHLPRAAATDYLASREGGGWIEDAFRPHGVTRGTGCALATAIACGLARGEAVPDAVRRAKSFIVSALDAGYRAGRGRFLGMPGA
jgi:hydroxymethylpyrimidine/phosphomethylpyrimidine kinase